MKNNLAGNVFGYCFWLVPMLIIFFGALFIGISSLKSGSNIDNEKSLALEALLNKSSINFLTYKTALETIGQEEADNLKIFDMSAEQANNLNLKLNWAKPIINIHKEMLNCTSDYCEFNLEQYREFLTSMIYNCNEKNICEVFKLAKIEI